MDERMKERGRNERVNETIDLAMDVAPSDEPSNTVDERDGPDYHDRLLSQVSERMQETQTYWQPMHSVSREDFSFAYDSQWPEEAMADRENRPMLTINQIPQFIFRVVNDIRKTRLAINVDQSAGKNEVFYDKDGEGTHPYTRSTIMEGLIRDIERESKAAPKYSAALQQALEGGFGWLQVMTQRDPADPFGKCLRIGHVRNRYSVMMDPLAREPDCSDARFCAKYMDVPKDEYEKRWGMEPATLPGGPSMHEGSLADRFWSTRKNTVRVLDYWWKEPMEREAVELVSVRRNDQGKEMGVDRLVVWEDEAADVLDELVENEDYEIQRRKKVMHYRVRYMRCTRDKVLDGIYDWPSERLPIVPVFGRTVSSDDQVMYLSLHRHAHDACQMLNYWASATTEKLSLQPKQPMIVAAEQIAGYEAEWNNQNTANQLYLRYNHLPDVEKPGRLAVEGSVTAEFQMMGMNRNFIFDTVGMPQATMGRQSNEVSGIAIQQRSEQGEMHTYDYVDNLATAITAVGEILADMIPRVYSNDVARKVVLPDDKTIKVELNRRVVDEDTGREVRLFSLDFARYSCSVSIGPSSETNRKEAAKMITEWGRSDPEAMFAMRDILVKNMDVPNAKALAERMMRLLPRHLLSEEELKMVPEPEPTVAEKIEMARAEADMMKARADMMKAEADIEKAKAGVAGSHLKTQSDEARLGYEVAKGENRMNEQGGREAGDGRDREDRVREMVEREVAQAIARARPR